MLLSWRSGGLTFAYASVGASSTEEIGGGAGGGLAGAAVTGLYTGLKFTGLAVRVAGGLAASISKDAERAMAAMEEQRWAQVRAWGFLRVSGFWVVT